MAGVERDHEGGNNEGGNTEGCDHHWCVRRARGRPHETPPSVTPGGDARAFRALYCAAPMTTVATRVRAGNLTAALVAFAFLELVLNRLANRLFLPQAAVVGESAGSPTARAL